MTNLVFFWSLPLWAQTFNSGSTGSDGAFAPTCTPTPCSVTVPLTNSGIFNFTTVTIPSGVTVKFAANAANTPVTLLATGDVTVASGAIMDVSGSPGIGASASRPIVHAGGPGGPGGFAGGQGGARGSANSSASAGQGPGGGGLPSSASGFCGVGGTYGAPASFTSLIPLLGGSGGGGQNSAVGGGGACGTGGTCATQPGSSGGGGGGAMLIASSTRIIVNGSIKATGGLGGTVSNLTVQTAGSGSGGAIRLVAPQISGVGTLDARSTITGCVGEPGRIRLEASTLTFTGTSNPAASTSSTPGPVTAASIPPLTDLPTLRISAIGGAAAPPASSGFYTTADVTLAAGTINPAPVTLTATNIPVGTVFSVKLVPQFSGPVTVTTSPSTGTFATSTAAATVSFPTGQISVLNAFGSFTLPQIAGFFPLIDGEPVDRMIVATTDGGTSIVTLISRSGKNVPADPILFRKIGR
ncbi:MAG: hypothetical protein ACREJU_20035 [Nitrospiraceae bacterium]